MERFKKIAYLYSAKNNDKVALQRMASLAEMNNARVQAVNVTESVSAVAQMLIGKEKVLQYETDRQSNVADSLAKLIAELNINKIPLSFASGDSAFETIRFVLSNKCDLLIKIRDTPSAKESISTSDMKLLRKCPVPVMLLKPSRKKSFTRVMAAIDLGPDNSSNHSLIKNILKLAVSMSEREAAELDIVHAWKTFSATTLQGPRFKMSTDEVAEIAKSEKALRQQWMDEALAPYRDISIKLRSHLIEGDPSEVIAGFAKKRRVDLVVMGSLARSGFQGLLIGNTAERVLDTVNCSTLTIKPDDFICPIKA